MRRVTSSLARMRGREIQPRPKGLGFYVHGTGKFAGISGEGKWLPIGVFPPTGMPDMTTACNHEWGTYNIK